MFRLVKLPKNVEGQLFLHSMPGRSELLENFLDEVTHSNINLIVSLASTDEIMQKSHDYYILVKSKSFPFEWINYEIPDFGIPNSIDDFLKFVLEVREKIKKGTNILVHCGAGIGRTGMFAVCLLISLGLSKKESYKRVISVGSNPEVDTQRDFINRFEVAFKKIGKIIK